MNTIHNERIKLAAAILNNLAAAMAVAGFIAPAASGQLVTAGRLFVALVWVCLGAGLHWLASAVLGGLQE